NEDITAVTLVEIQEEVKKLSAIRELVEKLRVPEGHASNYLTLIVRELVRLHEHAHAYLHTAIIEASEGCAGRTVELDWWKCKEVNEPLAEKPLRLQKLKACVLLACKIWLGL
ncbi:MAG: hypothetical protein QXT30_07625, partial [Candidatus Bathyarchaeia archaeon]